MYIYTYIISNLFHSYTHVSYITQPNIILMYYVLKQKTMYMHVYTYHIFSTITYTYTYIIVHVSMYVYIYIHTYVDIYI